VLGGGRRLVSSRWVLGARRVHTRPVDIGCGGRGEGHGEVRLGALDGGGVDIGGLPGGDKLVGRCPARGSGCLGDGE
jgi:hypothetical protein